MATPAHTIDELLEAVLRLERKVDAVLRPTPKLLSKRAASKILGVDRGADGKLDAWIRCGALRVVDGKIPLADVERIATEGPPQPRPIAARARRRAPVPRPADAAAEIRKLRI